MTGRSRRCESHGSARHCGANSVGCPIAQGPDGCLYVTTSNRDKRGKVGPEDDRVLKLVPGVLEARTEWKEQKAAYPDFIKICMDWNGRKVVGFGEKPDLRGDQRYAYVQLGQDGEVVKVVRRTNPNAQWDWYQVGGRWKGFFTLKDRSKVTTCERDEPGDDLLLIGEADSCLKGEIDFEAMRNEKGREAGGLYDLFTRLTKDCPPPIPWSVVRKQNPDSIDAARCVP